MGLKIFWTEHASIPVVCNRFPSRIVTSGEIQALALQLFVSFRDFEKGVDQSGIQLGILSFLDDSTQLSSSRIFCCWMNTRIATSAYKSSTLRE
jgi:hypothetical protein